MVKKKRRFFKENVKKSKFNKFFSYKNANREDRNFLYKNFEKSNSYNTRFTRSSFQYVNFYKSTMKYCGFNGALFENVYFIRSSVRKAKGLQKSIPGITVLNTMPIIELSDRLKKAIITAAQNPFIKEAEVLIFKKKQQLNTINIVRLLRVYSEEQLIIGLERAKSKINRKFYTLSYITSFIKKELAALQLA